MVIRGMCLELCMESPHAETKSMIKILSRAQETRKTTLSSVIPTEVGHQCLDCDLNTLITPNNIMPMILLGVIGRSNKTINLHTCLQTQRGLIQQRDTEVDVDMI